MASNSLLYGPLELLGGAGGTFNITTGQRGLGDPTTVSQKVQSELVDGSLVTGSFLDNRPVNFTILITATSRPGLAAATDALARLVYNPMPQTLTWSPAGGLPLVFDTFRGQMHIQWSSQMERVFARQVQIVMEALPTGRSTDRQTIGGSAAKTTVANFNSPGSFTYKRPLSSDGTQYLDMLQGDPASTTGVSPAVPLPTTGTNHAAITSSPSPYQGAGSTQIDLQPYEAQAAYSYTYTYFWSGSLQTATVNVPARGVAAGRLDSGAVTLNLSAVTNLRAAIFTSYNRQAVYIKMTDSHAVSATLAMTAVAPSTTNWSTYQVDLTAATTLDLANIRSWSIYVAIGDIPNYVTGMAVIPAYLGQLDAYPQTSTGASTARGAVFKIANVLGSAPAPCAIEIDRGGTNTMSGLLVYKGPTGSALTTPILLATVGGVATTVAPSTFRGTYRLIAGSSSGVLPGLYNATIQQQVNGANVGPLWTGPAGVLFGNFGDLGEVTLPIVDLPPTVTNVTYVITYTGGGTPDLMLLDTTGRLVWVPSFTAAKYVWLGESSAVAGLGGVFAGSLADESDATSLLASTGVQLTGAMSLDPGDNYLLAWCPDNVPTNVAISYAPRWLTERVA